MKTNTNFFNNFLDKVVKKNLRPQKSLLILLLSMFFAYLNCSDVNLSPIGPPTTIASSDGLYCLEPPSKAALYSKILFIVDQSGSNQGDPQQGITGTDPQLKIRKDSILKFVEQYKDNTYYKWSLIGFKEANGIPYTQDGQSNPIFVPSSNMLNAVNSGLTIANDTGCTPYLAALSRAKQAIDKDMIDHPEEESIYNVFFLSDGGPRITGGTSQCDLDQVQNSTSDKYLMAVKSIREKDVSKIFLSTVYYNTTNRIASESDGLSYMAKAGDGTFTDMTAASEIDFKELRVGEKPQAWIIKGPKIVTYNLSSAFCDDKTINADSSTSGICDKDKERFNKIYANEMKQLYGTKTFSPTNRNSFDPNYSDAFIWKFNILLTGKGTSTCNNKKINGDVDILNSCEKAMIHDVNANGPTPQWTTYMNNQGGSSADPLNPDSDGDLFLDAIEFFTFRAISSFSAAVNHTNIRDFWANGVDGDEILYHHRNFMNPSSFGPENYDTTVTFHGINDKSQNCYDFTQKQLALYPTQALTLEGAGGLDYLVHSAGENVVLIYFLATPEDDPNGTGILYYSYQKLNYNKQGKNAASALRLDQFKTYKIPKQE